MSVTRALIATALVAVMIGTFVACSESSKKGEKGGAVFVGRCVNDLGQNRDEPGKNSCDGKELGSSCSGTFGAGSCRSTAD